MNTNTKLLDLLKDMKNDCYTMTGYEKLYNAIMDNIREESVKSGIGSKKQLTIIKSMMAGVKNNANFTKAHTYNEMYAFIDGIRIFITSNNYDYEVLPVENSFKIDPIISGCSENNTCIEIDTGILATHIKQHSKKDKKPFIIKYNDKFIGVNAYYLRDALQFVGNNNMYINVEFFKNGVYKSQLYFKNENNDCSILLPINISGSDKTIADIEIIDESEKAIKEKNRINQDEKNAALINEVIEENNQTIKDCKKEYNHIYDIVSNEINAGILKQLSIDDRISYVDKYDCFISIYEDINNIMYNESDYNIFDHINYKLYNYGYNYIGTFNENTYKFEYRKYKVYNHMHYRIALEMLESIEIYLSNLLALKDEKATA